MSFVGNPYTPKALHLTSPARRTEITRRHRSTPGVFARSTLWRACTRLSVAGKIARYALRWSVAESSFFSTRAPKVSGTFLETAGNGLVFQGATLGPRTNQTFGVWLVNPISLDERRQRN